MIGHLNSMERNVLMPGLNEYIDLFQSERSGLLPCTNKSLYENKTGDALPIKKNPYKAPFARTGEMCKQLHEMLQTGVIIPAFSERAAPIILVKKKSLDNNTAFSLLYRFS
jgi:hypothetical protein